MIVGRNEERRVLEALLCDQLAEPRALLIEGEPGIGKTTLLRELITSATHRGHRLLSCRPTESEMELSYVGLIELLDGLDDEVGNELPAPQARLLRMILRKQEPEGRFDRLSLNVAVVAAVRMAAATRPTLITIDDMQWLDPSTAKTLAFLVRRLSGTGVRLAIVRRAGQPVDLFTELTRALPVDRVDTLRLGPVDPSELSRILRRALGWAPAWPRVVRIAQLSGGNPLFAIEFARAAGTTRSRQEFETGLPHSVVELAQARIAKLPDKVRAVLELAAVPRAPTVDLLGRLDPAGLDSRDALASAERSGLVSVEGESIRFTHPILAAAVYGSIPLERKRHLHRSVAVLVSDLEERARHLAAAAEGPDAEVAHALASAAEDAWYRGAPDAAADLLRTACRLTPPSDVGVLVSRRIAFGRLLHAAGDAPAAVAELEAVVAELHAGPIRARALYHLMYVVRLSYSLESAIEVGTQAAVEAEGDPGLQAEVYQLLSRIWDCNVQAKLDAARKAIAALDRMPDPDPYLLFYSRAALVEAEFHAGLGIHLERLEGLDPGARRPFPPVRAVVHAEDLIGRLLVYDGRIDEGLAVLHEFLERVTVEGRSVMPAVLGWMAEAHCVAGRFAVALALGREAIEHAEEIGAGGGMAWAQGWQAVALAMLGRLDEAELAGKAVVDAINNELSVGWDQGPALLALGIAALAGGKFDDAVRYLQLLDQVKRRAGFREPRVCAHVSDLVEALIGLGALDEAVGVVDRLDEEAATSGSPWSLGVAARCRALMLAASGRLDDALGAASQSLALLDEVPMPFERARSLFVLGQIHRRSRQKQLARDVLGAALTAFEQLQTPVWAVRTGAELARIPQRHEVTGLTATEERVAQLAAQGLTNREIAGRVFVSAKTVEVNLTRIYRKLGVRSRAALATRLAIVVAQSPPTIV